MKKIFFVFLFALTAIASQGQNVVHRMDTVYLCKVDILDLILQYSKLDSVKQLKLVGKLNGDDIKFLRDMMGADRYTGYSHPERRNKLEVLDLSETRIYAGGTSYCINSLESFPQRCKLYTKNDTIPKSMFECCIGLKKIILPSTIKSIEDMAFGECTFDSIQIPENVENVICPFTGCKHLKWIGLPSTLKRTQLGTFDWYVDSLNTVVCAAVVPPACECSSVDPSSIDCKLIVPAGCKQAYMNAAGWNRFKTIVEQDTPDKIKGIKSEGDAKVIARYAIDGKKLSVPQSGLNIIKMSDGETKKVNVE